LLDEDVERQRQIDELKEVLNCISMFFFSGPSPKLKLTEIDLITINLVSTKWYRNEFGRETLTLSKKKLKWKFSKCWSTVDAEKCTKQYF
jgi:hypothetical protein